MPTGALQVAGRVAVSAVHVSARPTLLDSHADQIPETSPHFLIIADQDRDVGGPGHTRASGGGAAKQTDGELVEVVAVEASRVALPGLGAIGDDADHYALEVRAISAEKRFLINW